MPRPKVGVKRKRVGSAERKGAKSKKDQSSDHQEETLVERVTQAVLEALEDRAVPAIPDRSESPQSLDEGNTTWRVNAVELWRCLQIVISTKQQMQSLRECLDLYMKVIGPHDTFRDYFTGSRGEGFYFDWSDIDILNSSITECVSMDNE